MRQATGHGPQGASHGGRPPGAPLVERAIAPPLGRSRSCLRRRDSRLNDTRTSGSSARTACAATGAVLLLLAAGAAPAFAASKERDVQLVYCLAAVHRADLVDAAVHLRLLRADSVGQDDVRPVAGGKAISLERWSELYDEDFARACSALMDATPESPGPTPQDGGGDSWVVTFLKGLPVLAAGALLTVGGQLFERGTSERRLLRQQLGTDEAAYRTAVREYLAAYERDPHTDHSAVRAAREALAGTLSRVPGPPARRQAALEVADGLPLARPLPAVREGTALGTGARTRETLRAQETADRLLRSVPNLNRRSTYWSWRTLRGRYDRGTTPGAAV